MCPLGGEIGGEDLTCMSVDTEVQLPPGPVPGRSLDVPDVNPEPSAVDEQMDRSIGGEPTAPNVTKLLQSPRQGRVIGDRQIDFELLDKGTKEPLGLAKRKMEDHADHQGSLDRDVRIPALTAGLAAGRSSPSIECVITKPDRQFASLPQTGLVLRPVSNPISRLRVLVLAALRILHSCRLRITGFASP
jgi:hypothetical protein